MSAARLSAEVAGFDAYDRGQAAGVVHLGTGAFTRAHQAVYFDRLLAGGGEGWLIDGASLRSATVARQMNPQDGLYTVVVRDGEGERRRIVGSIRKVLVAPQDPAALVAALAAPETALVTLTVTEKGYLIDPDSGALRTEDSGVAADLKAPGTPSTVPGFLVAALRQRREAGAPPLTILSCDNLPGNGERTRGAALAFAERLDPDLARWIDREVAFPSSMVDRIVPATGLADIGALEATAGYRDEAMVKTEPFTQWVVEDSFAGRRPALESVGVQFTHDVAGWEKVKLRLLNGAHSALAYLGALAGHEFMHQVMAAPGFAVYVGHLWDEAEATLPPLSGFDAADYRESLAGRFRNDALQHRTVQIAMDGSQKLPQRFLGSIRDLRQRGARAPALTLAVAAWMRWQFGKDESGAAYKVDDPLADRTAAAVRDGGDAEGIARAMLGIESIFAAKLADDEAFAAEVAASLERLMQLGAAETVRRFAGGEMA